MEKEYQILTYLQDEEFTSQRKIAEGTGLSLGTVNILLKKLAQKGLVKIERLNARSLRYILTPRGIAEKTHLTYRFIKQSYSYVTKINSVMDNVVKLVKKHELGEIILFGPRNEVFQILSMTLEQKDADYRLIKKEENLPPAGEIVVVVWDLKDEELLKNYSPINVLKVI